MGVDRAKLCMQSAASFPGLIPLVVGGSSVQSQRNSGHIDSVTRAGCSTHAYSHATTEASVLLILVDGDWLRKYVAPPVCNIEQPTVASNVNDNSKLPQRTVSHVHCARYDELSISPDLLATHFFPSLAVYSE
jgi:hypothetical protein